MVESSTSSVAAPPPAPAPAHSHSSAHAKAKPHAAPTVHKPVPKGAFGVETTPRPVRSDSAKHAGDPKTLAFRAETLAGAVQDARINESDNIAPIIEKASQATVANLAAVRKIDDHNAVKLEATRTEFKSLVKELGHLEALLSDPSHEATPSETARLQQLRQDVDQATSRLRSADKASERSSTDVAVALDLHETVLGFRPGRVALAKNIGLADARAAQAEPHSAWHALSEASKHGKPIDEVSKQGKPIDGDRRSLLQKVRDAASFNRSQWEALSSRAEKGHNAELIAESRAGLAKAKSVFTPCIRPISSQVMSLNAVPKPKS